MVGYKNGNSEDHTSLTALTTGYLHSHRARIVAALGGEVDQIVVVPSSRPEREFDKHPLARVIRRSLPFQSLLTNGLAWVRGASLGRAVYDPDVYRTGGVPVDGKRVLLLEDLWVTGAHPLSAAGKLVELGASAVAIVSIAREVSLSFCGESHPYLTASKQPFDISSWPRA